MMLPGFVGPSYVGPSPWVGCEESWNLFAVLEREALLRAPGQRTFGTAGVGPIRGQYRLDGRYWVASGAELYEGFSDGTFTLRGAIAPGTGPVEFDSNGTGGLQLAVLSSGFLYVLGLTTNTLTLVADADLTPYQGRIASFGFADGYGLAHVRDTALFFASALEDFTSWDPTDVFQKSRTSDLIRKMVIDHGQAWLFGSENIEPWYDSGDANTPWQPVPDVIINQGILGSDTWTVIDETIFWIGENRDGGRKAFRAAGFNRQRISTDAVETEWATYGTLADATMWDYEDRGHACIQVDFPSEGVSWVYDITTNFWFKAGVWNANAGRYDAHLGRNHVFMFDKHLVGSRIDGTVYEQTHEVYANGPYPQRWMRRAPCLAAELRNVVHPNFWVDADVGSTPLLTGQGSDPQMLMRFSDTKTRTWSVERARSMGVQGAYTTRVLWNRLGLAKGPHGRVYEISGTDPVPLAITGAGVGDKAA